MLSGGLPHRRMKIAVTASGRGSVARVMPIGTAALGHVKEADHSSHALRSNL